MVMHLQHPKQVETSPAGSDHPPDITSSGSGGVVCGLARPGTAQPGWPRTSVESGKDL